MYTGFANSGNSQAQTWNPYFLTAPDGATRLLVPTANDLVVTVSGGGRSVTVAGSVSGSLVQP